MIKQMMKVDVKWVKGKLQKHIGENREGNIIKVIS